MQELKMLRTEGNIAYYAKIVLKGDEEAFKKDLESLNLKELTEIGGVFKLPPAGKEDLVKQIIKKTKAVENVTNKTEEAPAPVETTPEPKVETPKKDRRKGKTRILVCDELKALFPRPSKSDLALMRSSIEQNGLFTPIQVLANAIQYKGMTLEAGTVIDGHTRLDILDSLQIPLEEDRIEHVFLTEADLETRICANNLARRQLTDIQRISLVKEMMPAVIKSLKPIPIEEKPKEEEAPVETVAPGKKPKKAKEAKTGSGKKKTVREQVAEMADVSDEQVKRHDFLVKYAPDLLKEQEDKGPKGKMAFAFAKAQRLYDTLKSAPPWGPELLKRCAAGEFSVTKAIDMLRDEEKAAKALKKAEEVAAKKEASRKPQLVPKGSKNAVIVAVTDLKTSYISLLAKKYANEDKKKETLAGDALVKAILAVADGTEKKYIAILKNALNKAETGGK